MEKNSPVIFLESCLPRVVRGAKYNADFSRSTRRFHPRRIELCRKTKDDDGEAVSFHFIHRDDGLRGLSVYR